MFENIDSTPVSSNEEDPLHPDNQEPGIAEVEITRPSAIHDEYMNSLSDYVRNNPEENPEETRTRFSTALNLNNLANTRIAVIGAGGIGSPIIRNLVAMGATDVHVFDFDTVEIHNIGTQFYRMVDIGKSKVQAMQDAILERYFIKIFTYNTEVESLEDIRDQMPGSQQADIVISAVDNQEFRNKLVKPRQDMSNPDMSNLRSSLLDIPPSARPELLVDCRMSLGLWNTFILPINKVATEVSNHNADRLISFYEENGLFPAEEGMQESCTERALIYTGDCIGAYVCAFIGWVTQSRRLNLPEEFIDTTKPKTDDCPFKWTENFDSQGFRSLSLDPGKEKIKDDLQEKIARIMELKQDLENLEAARQDLVENNRDLAAEADRLRQQVRRTQCEDSPRLPIHNPAVTVITQDNAPCILIGGYQIEVGMEFEGCGHNASSPQLYKITKILPGLSLFGTSVRVVNPIHELSEETFTGTYLVAMTMHRLVRVPSTDQEIEECSALPVHVEIVDNTPDNLTLKINGYTLTSGMQFMKNGITYTITEVHYHQGAEKWMIRLAPGFNSHLSYTQHYPEEFKYMDIESLTHVPGWDLETGRPTEGGLEPEATFPTTSGIAPTREFVSESPEELDIRINGYKLEPGMKLRMRCPGLDPLTCEITAVTYSSLDGDWEIRGVREENGRSLYWSTAAFFRFTIEELLSVPESATDTPGSSHVVQGDSSSFTPIESPVLVRPSDTRRPSDISIGGYSLKENMQFLSTTPDGPAQFMYTIADFRPVFDEEGEEVEWDFEIKVKKGLPLFESIWYSVDTFCRLFRNNLERLVHPGGENSEPVWTGVDLGGQQDQSQQQIYSTDLPIHNPEVRLVNEDENGLEIYVAGYRLTVGMEIVVEVGGYDIPSQEATYKVARLDYWDQEEEWEIVLFSDRLGTFQYFTPGEFFSLGILRLESVPEGTATEGVPRHSRAAEEQSGEEEESTDLSSTDSPMFHYADIPIALGTVFISSRGNRYEAREYSRDATDTPVLYMKVDEHEEYSRFTEVQLNRLLIRTFVEVPGLESDTGGE